MRNIKRLLTYTKPYKWHLICSSICLLIVTGINLLGPWLVRNLVSILDEDSLSSADMPRILRLAAILTGTYLIKIIFRYAHGYLSHYAAWKVVTDIRILLYTHLQKLTLRFYHDKQTGELMSRVVNDTATFENMIAHAIPDVVSNLLVLIGVTVILFFINVNLALFTMIPIPFIAMLSWLFMKKILPYFREAQGHLADLNASLQDNLSGIKEIQVFNQQSKETGVISGHARKYENAILHFLRKAARFHPSIEAAGSMGTVIVVSFGGYLAIHGRLSVSDIVGFLLYLSLFYQPVSALARVTEDLQHGIAGAERVFEVFDTDPDIVDSADALPLPTSKGKVTFENVCFHYVENIPVLQDVSFEAQPGQMIALVGPTGVGKTTIINLIARFYDPISGTIKIDDTNIKDITISSLRDQISIVLQDVFLFNGTVYENIAYSKKNTTRAQVISAAKAAKIHEFIESLPDGYETAIGERGVKLSGGQKQRLAIARSILRDTPLLILDEATASVDVETEQEIQHAIQSIAGTRTIIVIAHRLSTVKRADNILVLKDGQICESGTHEDLISQGGLYKELCDIQFAVNSE